jgi:hypothetical protein
MVDVRKQGRELLLLAFNGFCSFEVEFQFSNLTKCHWVLYNFTFVFSHAHSVVNGIPNVMNFWKHKQKFHVFLRFFL